VAPVPTVAGERAAVDAFAELGVLLGLGSNHALQGRLRSNEGYDLHQGRALLECVHAVGSGGDERKVDGGPVRVGIDHAGEDLDDVVGPVDWGEEEAAPALVVGCSCLAGSVSDLAMSSP